MGRTACEQVKGSPRWGRGATREYGAEFRGATVQRIAISGDRAAATFSNGEMVQLQRIATGEWLIDRLGQIGGVASAGLLPCVHRRASCR
jgi:hypothetical protein